jgi:hypothetical protein
MKIAVLTGLLFVIGGGALWAYDLRSTNITLGDDLARVERELTVQGMVLEQSRFAADVAKANSDRLEVKAIEYDEIKKWINGQDDESPMPDLLRVVFDRMLGSND